MKHTITVTISVEADTDNRALVIDELLGHITDLQNQQCSSCEVLPDMSETDHKHCTLSVEFAESEGARTTAGWAVI